MSCYASTSHPLGGGAQEAEERRVEVQVLRVELLQLLHSNVNNLPHHPKARGRSVASRTTCDPQTQE